MNEYVEDLGANERVLEAVIKRTEDRVAMHRVLFEWLDSHIRDNYRHVREVLEENNFTNISEATEIIVEKFREEIIDKGLIMELIEFTQKACQTFRTTNEAFFKKEIEEIREIRKRYWYTNDMSIMSDYERNRIIELNKPMQTFVWHGIWAGKK